MNNKRFLMKMVEEANEIGGIVYYCSGCNTIFVCQENVADAEEGICSNCETNNGVVALGEEIVEVIASLTDELNCELDDMVLEEYEDKLNVEIL